MLTRPLDGISLVPLLTSSDMPERTKPLVWTYYNAINDARVAMRIGPWKVLARLNSGKFPRYENLTPQRLQQAKGATLTDFEIYKVSEGPGETLNLAGRGLENEQQLTQQLESEYRSLVNDSFAWDRQAE